jgi:cytochrome c
LKNHGLFYRPAGISAIAAAFAAIMLSFPNAAVAQLRGHGGPVRSLAISADGQHAISGSFDSSAIRWSLARNAAEQVLRFHDNAVNAVVFLSESRLATAGADGRICIWTAGKQQPDTVLEGHTAPIAALAVSPDGATLASASWDQTIRLWPLAGGGGAPRVLEGHTQNVNGVAFTPDGRFLVSAGYDLTLRIWPLTGGGSPVIVTLPSPPNAVVVAPDGEIATGAADGKVYFLTQDGAVSGDIQTGPSPVISMAISNDGALIAAAGIRGSVAIIDRKQHTIARTLVGPGLPVWSVAFFPDSRTLLTGGADRVIRRWDAVTGEPMDSTTVGALDDPLAAYAGDPGADVFRACVACHTLSADAGPRAGPTLAGIFGRRIATLSGYNFSEALKKLDIVWTPETVGKLFEVGPATYTPGTKMPDQRIGSPDDRRALNDFLARATKK